jgi:hypothetical protein
MRTKIDCGFACAALAVALWGCAERQDTSEILAHPQEWSTVEAADFHGRRVEGQGTDRCVSCHGIDLDGAGAAPSCYECHDGPGGHPDGWSSRPVPGHRTEIALRGNGECRACHGETFTGGWSGVSCYACHAGGPSGHADGWMNERSAAFHGYYVATNSSLSCTDCHGMDLLGGSSGVACSDCH